MITRERLVETLEPYEINDIQMDEWESILGLEVPLDQFENKLYSNIHVRLFQNIKKHIDMGRSIEEIQQLVVLPKKDVDEEALDASSDQASELSFHDTLYAQQDTSPSAPPAEIARPPLQEQVLLNEQADDMKSTLTQRLLKEIQHAKPTEAEEAGQRSNIVPLSKHRENRVPDKLKKFASPPRSLSSLNFSKHQGPNAGMLLLIDRLVSEKDQVANELLQMEKLNSHLYQANTMFKQKIEELTASLGVLEKNIDAQENLNKHVVLMNEKAMLQKQLLEAEQRYQTSQKENNVLHRKTEQLQLGLEARVSPSTFVGNWLEESTLRTIEFDNFGINIESKRHQMFRVADPPKRQFGHGAVIETTHYYQTNSQWQRQETLIVSIANENHLEGELMIEYILNHKVVAKAFYDVACYRNGKKADTP